MAKYVHGKQGMKRKENKTKKNLEKTNQIQEIKQLVMASTSKTVRFNIYLERQKNNFKFT